jgi:hypothetical protein
MDRRSSSDAGVTVTLEFAGLPLALMFFLKNKKNRKCNMKDP